MRRKIIIVLAVIVIIVNLSILFKSNDTKTVKQNTSATTTQTTEEQTINIDTTKSEIIETGTEITETETTKSYSEKDLYMLSHLIYGEASGCSYEFQLYVGSVVLNRVKHNNYPDDLESVIFQNGQYACTWDGNYKKEPNKQAIEAAEYLLENGSQIPSDVIYQAEFVQGKVWKQIGNTYFCYG